MVNVMQFHKVLILMLISGVAYVSASDIHNHTSKLLLSDNIIGLEQSALKIAARIAVRRLINISISR